MSNTMNNKLFDILAHVTTTFIAGILIGILVSIFTIFLIKKLAKRAERYELTYMPITLVESKMRKCIFIVYPLAFGIAFAAGGVVMKLLR